MQFRLWPIGGGIFSLTGQWESNSTALLTAQLFCLSFLLCPSLDGDDDALNQRMSHKLFGTCNTSPSPDFPVSSGLEWLGKKHRSYSFTSGFTAVFLFKPQWHKMLQMWFISRCLFPPSNFPEDQACFPYICRPRPGKRFQLLCDPGGRRQVIRQSGRKQKHRPPAAGLSWVAARHLPGICSEELYHPAATSQ